MGWSFRIARIFGIDLKVHVTFFLILVWVMIQFRDGGASAMARGVLLALLIFACVVLHEFGHALTARRFGVRTKDIILLPIGGVARLERMPEKPLHELIVALAGPAVNVVIATVLLLFLGMTGTLQLQGAESLDGFGMLTSLAAINVVLVVFNMIPAFPMDGGRVLRALLAMRLPRHRATRIAARLGQALAFVFGFLGLLGNPMLLFIALFVWIGAAQESSQLELTYALEGIPVSQVMLTDFYSLGDQEPLARAVELTIAGSQKDFPVVDTQTRQPIGVLTQGLLLQSLRSGELERPVGSAMEREFVSVDPRDMITGVFERLATTRQRTFPVVDGARLVGLLTLENVGEFLEMRKAVSASHDVQRHLA